MILGKGYLTANSSRKGLHVQQRLDSGTRAGGVLHEALIDGGVKQPKGGYRRVGANISIEHSQARNCIVRQRKPPLSVEIGMAYGVSTLSILEALES